MSGTHRPTDSRRPQPYPATYKVGPTPPSPRSQNNNTSRKHERTPPRLSYYVCIPLLRQPALTASNFNLGRAVRRHPRGGMAAFTTKSTNQVSFKSQNNYCHTLTTVDNSIRNMVEDGFSGVDDGKKVSKAYIHRKFACG